ncbi:hypothetical protein [Cellulomonas fimi]|uniref:Uncharacterized protein n=1 Tax=Cellulomonas fimi TaxID=1708 RepID=A0A7Y0LVZ2_CELFI|nr:hypothetical protein [Cellulomonas fimi]NMR18965.1 hypothetical protein [Cellulomonas fimi]
MSTDQTRPVPEPDRTLDPRQRAAIDRDEPTTEITRDTSTVEGTAVGDLPGESDATRELPTGATPREELVFDTFRPDVTPPAPSAPYAPTAPYAPSAPYAPADQGGTAVEAAPVARKPALRVGTVVWGLVLAVIGAGIVAIAAGVSFDLELASIGLLALAGIGLVVGSVATGARRRNR